MLKWEYETIHGGDPADFIAESNALGSKGWELVHIEELHGFLVGFFKKPVKE